MRLPSLTRRGPAAWLVPLSLAAGLMAAAGAAAPAAHAFGSPVDVSVGGAPSVGGVAVAGRAGGGATVAWRRASDGAVLARAVDVSGALGTVVTVSAGSGAAKATPP